MNNESTIAGVSVRAIIVLLLIVVFSISVFTNINNEALNSVVMAAIGWYFGQKSGSSPREPEPPQIDPIASFPPPPPPLVSQCKCPSCGSVCI